MPEASSSTIIINQMNMNDRAVARLPYQWNRAKRGQYMILMDDDAEGSILITMMILSTTTIERQREVVVVVAMMMTSEPKAKEQYYIVVVVVRSSAARTNCDYIDYYIDNGDDILNHDVALHSIFVFF